MYRKKPIPKPGELLTKREALVYKYVTEGKAYLDIAVILAISVHTVSNHMRNIFYKCDVNTRAELSAFAVLKLQEEIECLKKSCPVCSFLASYLVEQRKAG